MDLELDNLLILKKFDGGWPVSILINKKLKERIDADLVLNMDIDMDLGLGLELDNTNS